MDFLLKRLKKNYIHCTIVIYILTMYMIYTLKPNIIFNKYGDLKRFGVGYTNKTILPFWLVSILVSILSFYLIMIFCMIA